MNLADLYNANTDTALNHLSNWNGWHWAAAITTLSLIVGVVSPAAMLLLSDQYGNLSEAKEDLYLGVPLALAALAGFAFLVFQIARHSPVWQRGALATTLAVIVITATAFRFTKGLTPKLIAGGAALYGAAVLTIDGLHRVASWIPTTVGMVALGIVGILIYAYANSTSSNRTYRQTGGW